MTALLVLQNTILGMIARGDSLKATVERLCVEAEKQVPNAVCSVVTVDRAGAIRTIAAPSLPVSFGAAFDGIMIGPHNSSCGSAAYLRVPISFTDIERDPRWSERKDVALALGLRASWSFPVLDQAGTALAVFALYFRNRRGPTEQERQVVGVCSQLLEIAVQRHERVKERERRANIDALTDLPNRGAFNAALRKLPQAPSGSWALLMLDLDNLKSVNDVFGHEAGDALIQTAAERISRTVMPDLTFRLGGDEFAIIIQNDEALRDLQGAAARIFAALSIPADCHGNSIVPKATIGGAAFVAIDAGPDAVKQQADLALYHAKETGRGGFVRYWPGIGTSMTRRRDVIREVAAALDEGRLDAYYEPVFRLDTNEIVGVEARCTMVSTDGQVVLGHAIQEATTDAHVATELTRRMLSIIAKDVRHWLEIGLPFQRVGLNVSAADFYKGKLLDQIDASFAANNLPLDHFILEVNETVYVGQRDGLVAREVKALRARGLRVALDNFGAGSASLSQLLTLPADIIKISQTFIAQLAPADPSLAIVEGLIGIAKKLGMRVVAEGIETREQASQLRSMGCNLGQGLFYSTAVPRETVTALLRDHAQWVHAPDDNLGPMPSPRSDAIGEPNLLLRRRN